MESIWTNFFNCRIYITYWHCWWRWCLERKAATWRVAKEESQGWETPSDGEEWRSLGPSGPLSFFSLSALPPSLKRSKLSSTTSTSIQCTIPIGSWSHLADRSAADELWKLKRLHSQTDQSRKEMIQNGWACRMGFFYLVWLNYGQYLQICSKK